MADGPVTLCPPTSTMLASLQIKRDYLTQMSDFVFRYKHKKFTLESPAGAIMKIGDLDDTIYRRKHDEVNGWGNFFLPEIVSMQVVGVVKGTSCPCDQLVLMTCEDRKMYAYDGEELHEVASSFEQLCAEGIEYPASRSYYEGEAFKHMSKKDWGEVKKGDVGKSLDQEHHKLVTAEKSKFLQSLKSKSTVAAAHRMTREEAFLKKRDYFRRNAFLIIEEMVELSPQHPSVLVDEVLHGIFFLGDIFTPPYSPKDIVSDDDMLNTLKGRYPRPFKLYSSQVPKRSPISCVLDMIVHLTRQENEDQIVKKLRQLIVKLKKDEATDLISSTICVSQPNNTRNSPRYYGVSMSTSGRNPGRIMIAASCLSNWEHYVAGAVMTYYPNNKKKGYFDGTIKLPKQVRCQAFSLSREEEMPPCRSCGNLFGLTTSDTKEWPYGNCAEPECVSNLLKNEKEVREQARPKSPTCTDPNREKAKESVLKELTNILRMVRFSWDKTFYAPQV